MRLHLGAVILILLGIIVLLINLDIAPAAELKRLLAPWWPLLLIIVGVAAIMRPRRASESRRRVTPTGASDKSWQG